MTSPAEIDLHEQACSQLDTLYRHLRDGAAPGPTDLVTVLVAHRLLEDRLAAMREGAAATRAATPSELHSCRPDGVTIDGEVYTCPTCSRQWTFEQETHGWRADKAADPARIVDRRHPPTRPASPVDRHIARAAKATAPRRGRAPSSDAPCASGKRHRFDGAGMCKARGTDGSVCLVRRSGSATPAVAATPEPDRTAGSSRAFVEGSANEPAPPPAPHVGDPWQTPPPAKPPTKRRTMTVEMPDGSKLHPGETAPLVHHVPTGRAVADCGVKASWATPADAAARTTVTTDVTCPACIATA